jgi:hypothetical protein
LANGGIRDVDADDGKITVFEFPDVGTTPAGGGLGSVGVRVRTDAFDEIHTPEYLTIAK